jgi:hypothetical protein
MHRHYLCWLVAAALGATASSTIWGAPPKVALAQVDSQNRTLIRITFDNPLPAASAVEEAAYWIVYEKTTTIIKRLWVDKVDTSHLSNLDIVLQLREAVAGKPDIKEVQITLANDTDLLRLDPLTKPNELATGTAVSSGPVAAAKGKNDADIYFSGSYTAVHDGDPVWDIDAFAGYMYAPHADKYHGMFGLYGQVRTKQSPVADPNSFMAYFDYQYALGDKWWGPRICDDGQGNRIGVFQPSIFNYRGFGAEFDRNAKELNLITSPVLTIPIRPVCLPKTVSNKIQYWPQINLNLGAEFVNVRKSVLAPAGKWHTRGLLGTTLLMGWQPKTKLFDSWQISSSWELRLPSSAEIFYDPKFAPIDPSTGKRNSKKTSPMLGRQPRHYVDTKFTYNYTAWGGITLEYTYGSLPPTFNKTDHSVAFGLTFALQEGGSGRTSILRPIAGK